MAQISRLKISAELEAMLAAVIANATAADYRKAVRWKNSSANVALRELLTTTDGNQEDREAVTTVTASERQSNHIRRAETLVVPQRVIVCEDNVTFMRSLSASSMHLIVTSPPYNIGKEYETKTTLDEYLRSQRETIAEAVRLLHPRGSICWQVGNYVDGSEIFPLDILLYPLFKQHKLKLRNRIVWSFGHGLHCQNRFSGRHETVLWFTKSDDYIFNLDDVRVPAKYPNKKHFKGPQKGQLSGNPLGKNPADVWDIPNVKANHVEKLDHPCQFPVGLVERLVLALTDAGDSVLDPYLGVGSSAVAALKHKRHAFGCDIIPEYIRTAEERIRQLDAGKLRVRPMNKPVYEPSLRDSE